MSERDVVSILSKLPEPVFTKRDWPDYKQLGIGHDDFEELADLASSFYLSLEQTDEESALSIHAWRAMAGLGGEDVLPELMTLSIECDLIGDDWFVDEFPVLLGKQGMSALPELRRAVDGNPEYPCLAEGMVAGLPRMVRTDEERVEVVGFLGELFGHQDFDRVLRALIVESLISLNGVEMIQAIRDQFAKKAVDVSIVGDLEEVELEMGLRERRETPKPDFQILEQELALKELKAIAGNFPQGGSLDEKLHYFLLRYGNPRAIKRIDELDGYLLSCVLANPACSVFQASHCVWDTLNGSEDWQPDFDSGVEKRSWEQCLGEVLERIKEGLANGTYEPYALIWPDAGDSMDPDAPFFTPWLEGFMQGEVAFFEGSGEVLSEEFGVMVRQVFEMEGNGIRLLEDRDDNPLFLIVAEILDRYRGGSGTGLEESEFRFAASSQDAWLASGTGGRTSKSRKKKVERNEACPCGSGRKYKKCCMN